MNASALNWRAYWIDAGHSLDLNFWPVDLEVFQCVASRVSSVEKVEGSLVPRKSIGRKII